MNRPRAAVEECDVAAGSKPKSARFRAAFRDCVRFVMMEGVMLAVFVEAMSRCFVRGSLQFHAFRPQPAARLAGFGMRP